MWEFSVGIMQVKCGSAYLDIQIVLQPQELHSLKFFV